MLKSELINQLILKFPQLQASTVKKSVEHLIQLLEQTLHQGHRIEIRGFGSFSLHYNAARSAFNPKTKEHFLAPEKYRIHFKMGKTLKYCMNKPTQTTTEIQN
ncbi:hypothetical protein BEV13_01460 [Rickettsiella grylli]|nr:HU family DNA-binding protein [Rickettsiella grylli]OJA00986.1 hypothetical protein BEV13_01460 [Rickettsiella grylli]